MKENNSKLKIYAEMAFDRLQDRIIAGNDRSHYPSYLEINAVQQKTPIILKIQLPDLSYKAVAIKPSTTVNDLVRDLARQVRFQKDHSATLGLFVRAEGLLIPLRGEEFLCDSLSLWEQNHKN